MLGLGLRVRDLGWGAFEGSELLGVGEFLEGFEFLRILGGFLVEDLGIT